MTSQKDLTPTELKTVVGREEKLRILWDVAYKAMHESANLGTEKGVDEAKQIRDAIWDAQWAVTRGIAFEYKVEKVRNLKEILRNDKD